MVATNCRGSERTWSFLWSADVFLLLLLISDVVVMRGLLHAAWPSRCGSVVEGRGAEERQILRSSCCSSYWWGAARRLLRQMSFTPFQRPLLRRIIIARLLHKLWVYVGAGLVALGCNRPDQEREQARVTIQEAVHRTNKNKNNDKTLVTDALNRSGMMIRQCFFLMSWKNCL